MIIDHDILVKKHKAAKGAAARLKRLTRSTVNEPEKKMFVGLAHYKNCMYDTQLLFYGV